MKTPPTTRTARRRRGFTLAEVLIAALLLGLAFLALMAAYGHDSVVTQRGEDITRATLLADEIRDKALQMTVFADVLALNGTTYNPARLSTDETLTGSPWSQVLSVTRVSEADLNAANGAGKAARLTVEVRSNGKRVIQQTYYIYDMAGVPYN
jgi:prepilin-type N-terminal cleavage/methylation domain-containing protein